MRSRRLLLYAAIVLFLVVAASPELDAAFGASVSTAASGGTPAAVTSTAKKVKPKAKKSKKAKAKPKAATKTSVNPYETTGTTPGVPKNLETCAFFRKAYSQNFPCPGLIINVWDGWQPRAKIPMLPITFGAKGTQVDPVTGATNTQNVCWQTVGPYVIDGVFVAYPIGEGNYSYPSYGSGPHSGCANIPSGDYIIVEARPQLPPAKT